MLAYSPEKVKRWMAGNRTDLFTALVIFLIGIASFGLGRLSAVLPQKGPIRFEDTQLTEEQSGSSATARAKTSSEVSSGIAHPVPKNALFVASKSGSVYYAVWCSGVSRIHEENKVWFQTKEAAKVQGYRPAKNCPGL